MMGSEGSEFQSIRFFGRGAMGATLSEWVSHFSKIPPVFPHVTSFRCTYQGSSPILNEVPARRLFGGKDLNTPEYEILLSWRFWRHFPQNGILFQKSTQTFGSFAWQNGPMDSIALIKLVDGVHHTGLSEGHWWEFRNWSDPERSHQQLHTQPANFPQKNSI